MENERRKRGRPVTHPQVICLETGEIWPTYKAAAESIGGSIWGVQRCCQGVYQEHHGLHFKHVKNGPSATNY